jgi:hypothetical protein
VVTVEEVQSRRDLRRFVELPIALFGDDDRFAPPLIAYERWRLDPRRNPFFEHGDAAYLLARRRGVLAGRVTAHVSAPGAQGCFGFLAAVDDAGVVGALLDAARDWLAARGCRSMTGPVSFTGDDEPGLLVAGHDVAGLTGRPWHPAHLAAHAQAWGLAPAPSGDRPTWRLPAIAPAGDAAGAHTEPGPGDAGGAVPPHAGRLADPRLALGGVAAVPDVSTALRGARGLGGAVRMARLARERGWDTCVVVRCEGDPALLVPRLQAVAGAAGYRHVVAPWSPDPVVAPEAVHRAFRAQW